MTSSASSVNSALAEYLAGRMSAAQLSAVVAGQYYREPGAGSREQLRPIVEIIERAHPGVIELSASNDKPGFAVRLAERPFPKRYEADLRVAVQSLVAAPGPRVPGPGLFTRIVRAIRKIFSASA